MAEELGKGLVCRQDGPGPLVVYSDRGEVVEIPLGCWVTAGRTSAQIEQFGGAQPLPAGAMVLIETVVNGERLKVWESRSSKEAQREEQEGPTVVAEPAGLPAGPPADLGPAGAVIVPFDLADGELGRLRERDLSVVVRTAVAGKVSKEEQERARGDRDLVVCAPEDDLIGCAAEAVPEGVRWVEVVCGDRPLSADRFADAVFGLDNATWTVAGVIACGESVVVGAETMRTIKGIPSKDGRPVFAALLAACLAVGDSPDINLSAIKGAPKRLREAAKEQVLAGRDRQPPGVAVVVTVHNARRAVRFCLESLAACTFGGQLKPEVIIVDDQSRPDVQDQIDRIAGPHGWTVVRNKERLHYTRSAQAGIEVALRHGADWVCLLNSDTVVSDGWLWRMVRVGLEDDRIGLVGPLSNDAVSASVRIKGADPSSVARRLAYASRKRRPDIPTPTGFCLLIRRECWEKHGPFDHEYYGDAYGEECELWARMVKDGGRAVLADDAYVWHQGHASYGAAAGFVLEKKAHDLVQARHNTLLKERGPRFRDRREQDVAYVEGRLDRCRWAGRPRVCFYSNEFGMYGGVIAMAEVANRLAVRGWDVRWVTLQAEARALAQIPLVTRPIVFETHAAIVNEFKDRVFSEGVLVASVWNTANYVAEITQAAKGIKPVYFIQDYESEFTGPDGQLYTAPQNVWETYGKIGTKIVNSEWVHKLIVEKHKATGAEVIHVGVDLDVFYPGPPERDRQVLFFYRPSTPRRGHRLVERVCAALHDRDPSIRLRAFGGTGGLPPQVEQLGVISRDEVAEAFRAAGVFFEASSKQGFGLQGLEAMASGCALVSTKNQGIDSYGVDGRNCLTVSVDDEQAAVRAILTLLDDRPKRDALVAAGFRTAAAHDWWAIAKAHGEVYRRVLG
uniref:Putative glycosyltransferase n=1 Tax=viral metagenome TaxID=1070528 RepID=A0A6M3MBC3_9ZZZZ